MTIKSIEVNRSHGRPRTELSRPTDGGVPPIPGPAETAPTNEAKTGRFLPGNRAHRRRLLESKQAGIATLAPARCASWLSPSVKDGGSCAMVLMSRFPDPALARLVGATAEAHAMYRAAINAAAMPATSSGANLDADDDEAPIIIAADDPVVRNRAERDARMLGAGR